MKLLLAEDDLYLQSALSMALEKSGYKVATASNGTEALLYLTGEPFDVALLDLGLPEMDGMDVIAEARKRGVDIPIIVITARDSLMDKIAGLDIGANDYLVKPFDVRELEARLRAILRKSNWQNKVEIQLGSLCLNTESGAVSIGDKQIDLTPREKHLLQILMMKNGRVVSKRTLLNQMSDWLSESSENAIEIIIHRLRKKLDAGDVTINTVRGFGYTLQQT